MEDKDERLLGYWNPEIAVRLVEHNSEDWDYDAHFKHVPPALLPTEIALADALPESTNVRNHPFFDYAGAHPHALVTWVGQELFVTGLFAQLLLLTATSITNVHDRALFDQVPAGEHGPVRDGVARFAHPWLLHELAVSVGIDKRTLRILPPTEEFLRMTAQAMRTPMSALGCLGVGNEKMLVPEYAAVEQAFEKARPEARFRKFLRANIDEDTEHAAIISQVAANLSLGREDRARQYLDGARAGVEARMKYYDDLLDIVSKSE
ncbi:iron-containing redox enzyme family protein [Actinoplanes friuliensis]|uniref:Uncharacterized protein n=1 Tax=Actinoplanes friuliensis DSM 7358 TaxID=1246995 RepID=U5VW53_9ACTN|nr:iron-containing redox enzyme family protein [Actinoplanes friuliensis]AGZ41059.1 hypothetical protein AFR_13865 [Actinoplanes friuliensis DSM 7358]